MDYDIAYNTDIDYDIALGGVASNTSYLVCSISERATYSLR